MRATAAPVAVQAVVEIAEDDAPFLPMPSEADEAAFLAGGEEDGPAPIAVPAAAAPEPAMNGPMPSLNELSARIPPSVKEIMDDLFRARLTMVRRVPAKALKQP